MLLTELDAFPQERNAAVLLSVSSEETPLALLACLASLAVQVSQFHILKT